MGVYYSLASLKESNPQRNTTGRKMTRRSLVISLTARYSTHKKAKRGFLVLLTSDRFDMRRQRWSPVFAFALKERINTLFTRG
jgi:hypothetical protein